MVFPSFEVEEVFFERFSGFGVCTLICDVGIFFVSGALVVLTKKGEKMVKQGRINDSISRVRVGRGSNAV